MPNRLKSYYENALYLMDEKGYSFTWGMEQRNKVFWKVLQKAVSEAKFEFPKDRVTRVLSIACGEFEEARTIASFFSSGTYGLLDNSAEIYGIDINQTALEKALVLLQTPLPSDISDKFVLLPKFKIIVGDATNLSKYPEIPEQVDVAIMRHQFAAVDVIKKTDIWKKMLSQSIERLTKEGFLLVTSYNQEENQFLIQTAESLPANIVYNADNPHAIKFHGQKKEVWFDKVITLMKKK